jgi:ParB-like chromosome segregation protein Spo0J
MESPHLPDTVEHWPLERLQRYERNARTHTRAQVDQVATSILEFGFTNPLLVDPDGVLIAGHCRLAAAQKLGLPEVPVIVLGHLTPAQRRAYVIADNQLALQSGWDLGVLEAEIEALQVEGFDVELLGFDADELSQLLGGGDEDTDDGEDDDEDDVIDRSMALAIVLTPEEMAQWREAKAELGYSKDKTAFWQLVTDYLGEVRANG